MRKKIVMMAVMCIIVLNLYAPPIGISYDKANGIGGADSYTTPDRTIHSYVVNVKIDNMSTPLIYIATGQNEQKANEIAAVFEYILRHQPNKSNTVTTQKKKTTRRTKR